MFDFSGSKNDTFYGTEGVFNYLFSCYWQDAHILLHSTWQKQHNWFSAHITTWLVQLSGEQWTSISAVPSLFLMRHSKTSLLGLFSATCWFPCTSIVLSIKLKYFLCDPHYIHSNYSLVTWWSLNSNYFSSYCVLFSQQHRRHSTWCWQCWHRWRITLL